MLEEQPAMIGTATLAAALAPVAGGAQAQPSPSTSATTIYQTVAVDGVTMFYRRAGPADAPTVLLLHGYPSSSRMFAILIPLLAVRYHFVAPDYSGFGQSDAARIGVGVQSRQHLVQVGHTGYIPGYIWRPPWAARRHARSQATGLA